MNFNDTFIDNLIVSRSGHRPSRASEPDFWREAFLPEPQLENRTTTPHQPRRLRPFWLLLLLTTSVLVGRLYSLQVAHGRQNLALSEVNRVLSQVIRSERGVILDRNGEVLARNRPGFVVVLGLPPAAEVVTNLARALATSEEEIWAKVAESETEGKDLVAVKSDVDRDTALKIEANPDLFPGVSTEIEPLREYTAGEVFAPVLGFVGQASKEDLERFSNLGVRGGDKVGKTNLEFVYEPVLRGDLGERLIEVDAFGHRFRTLSERVAEPGDNLVLTVDAGLQKTSFAALSEGVEKSGAVGGAAVVQSVKNGEVLALVSWPSCDPTPFATGISESEYQKLLADPRRPLFNRTISASFPPGSTFKLVTAIAALEERVITPRTLIDDKGSISVGSFIFKGWAPEGLGPVNLVTAIAKSSDIYFYTVGGGYGGQAGVGVGKLADWARRFGLGSETGVDLTAEAWGLVPDPQWKLEARNEPWYIGNTYHMSIGQGDVLVTPLQLNNLVVAIANGGTLFRPFLVRDSPPEVLQANIASPETLDLVRQGMRAAASPGGTAYPVYDFKLPVAGKTGTSEIGGSDRTHAWFTCFAPYENPEIAVTVFLEEGGEGSDDAAPVVRKILEAYFGE